jgi:hypothetical protein
MAFSIIYFTHFFTLKSMNSSNRLSNNSILVGNSFDALLHGSSNSEYGDDVMSMKKRHSRKSKSGKNGHEFDEPGSEDFGSSEQENSLVEGWSEGDELDSGRFNLDKFDPEHYETEEDYGDDADDDDGEDDENFDEEDDEEDEVEDY